MNHSEAGFDDEHYADKNADNSYVIYDASWSQDKYNKASHVHTEYGSCMKNRFGPRCTPAATVVDPWAKDKEPPLPKPYLVQRISTDRSENELNRSLQQLLNSMAKDNYHPIKIEATHSSSYIISYTLIFYHMPNGPAFTPPF